MEKSLETSQLLPHTTQSLKRSNLGVIYTLLSSIILSLATTLIKTYSSINVLAVWVWIFPVTIIISILITSQSVLIRKKNIWRKLLPFNENKTVWLMTFAQGSLTCAISYSLSLSLQKISVADAKTIASTYVIFVYILSWLFLGEECSFVPIFACILTLLGIGVMMRPSFLTGEENFDINTLIGFAFAMCYVAAKTIGLMNLRYLRQVHEGMLTSLRFIWAFLQTFILALALGKLEMLELKDLLGIMSIGVLLSAGCVFEMMALKVDEAGVVALVRTSDIVFTFFWQFVLIGIIPDAFSVVGAAIILFGLFLVSLRKWVTSLDKSDLKRKRLSFLLL